MVFLLATGSRFTYNLSKVLVAAALFWKLRIRGSSMVLELSRLANYIGPTVAEQLVKSIVSQMCFR